MGSTMSGASLPSRSFGPVRGVKAPIQTIADGFPALRDSRGGYMTAGIPTFPRSLSLAERQMFFSDT